MLTTRTKNITYQSWALMILQDEYDTLKWSQLVFMMSKHMCTGFKTGAGGLFSDGLCWL